MAWLLAIAALAALTCGRRAAPGAVLVAGLGPAFTFYGAAPYAELPAGALALGGMVALGRVAQSGATVTAEAWPVAWRQSLASLAGLCLGLAALFKVDLLPAVFLVVLWWAWGPARRDPDARPLTFGLLVGLALPMIHFVLLGLGPTRTYLTINGWGVWQVLVARAWLLPWVAVLAAAALVMRLATGKGRRRFARRGPLAPERSMLRLPWRPFGGAAALLLAAGWSAQAWFAPAEVPASMPSVLAWLVTPLAAWGAAAGLALLLEDRRGDQREAFAVAPLASVLAPALVLALLPLVLPLVTRELSPLYVGRRLLPLCVPVVAVLAGAALGRLAAHERGAWRFSALPVAALVAFALWTSAGPWVPGRELAGSARLLERVASRLGEGDVLLLPSALGEDPAGRLGVALWAVHGIDVAVVGGLEESPTDLAAAVGRWRADGRRVLWASSGPSPRWPGLRAETVGREGIVSEVLAPDSQLPPRWERFEIALGIVELVEEPQRGR
jgi:hypothetical protein